jgi:hypothetical protein
MAGPNFHSKLDADFSAGFQSFFAGCSPAFRYLLSHRLSFLFRKAGDPGDRALISSVEAFANCRGRPDARSLAQQQS